MSAISHVEYESRVRVRYGVITFVAAVLLIGSQLLQLTGPNSDVSETTLSLVTASKREALDIASGLVYLLGMVALIVALLWLFRVSRHRNPGMKPYPAALVAVGASLAGITFTVYFIVLSIKGHDFVAKGNQGYPEAKALVSGPLLSLLQILLPLGWLLLAIGIVFVSLNAIRVGLITKLVGYFGVAAGALFIFQIGSIALLIQAFWLAALSVTLVARWPGGDPPAWQRGEAVPWPRAERQAPPPRQPRGQRGRRKVSDQEVLAAVERPDAPRTPTPSPSTSAGKRKRKRK